MEGMEISDGRGYPDNWEQTALWDGKLSVHFGYPEDGWILMSLLSTAFNNNIVIQCSDVYDPFWDLVDWLHRIADADLPTSFVIDEEGDMKELIVNSYNGRFSEFSDVEFRVVGKRWNTQANESESHCFLLTRCKRTQLVQEFARRLAAWLRDDYDPTHWERYLQEDQPENRYGNLRNLDVKGLIEKIGKSLNGAESP